MLGFAERISDNSVSGWAAHNGLPNIRVRVVMSGSVRGESVAHLFRTDVAEALRSGGEHGFAIVVDGEIPDDFRNFIAVQAFDGENWINIPWEDRAEKVVSRYQDFSGDGSSKSHLKLAALRLHELANAKEACEPLDGKSVLDLGCNEGFFCIEAIRQGAKRVVGIDSDSKFIMRARKRCVEAEFIEGSWWEIPDEKFDVILFLSSVHYEANQKAFFKKIRSHLNVGGTLILECGVFKDQEHHKWISVNRWDGERRYPTEQFLIDVLLDGYSVRPVGPSVLQTGDPVPRFVYYCITKQSSVLLITGPSRSGKTNLSYELLRHNIHSFSIDMLLHQLILEERHIFRNIAKRLRDAFVLHDINLKLDEVGNFVVLNNLHDDFAEILANEVPCELSMFCIQGEILRHASIYRAVEQSLTKKNIRVWRLEPSEILKF